MANVTPNINQTRAMRVAQRRIEGFAQQFGEAHRNLARHAAFPLSLTPDLLYQIWANFVPEAPWTAVAHVLLSRLCRQVGYEMYEMDISDRNLLLRELKEEFGQERFNELGEFLLDYVAQQLTEDDADTQDLREAQEWTALAYTKPDEAARELAQALSRRVNQEDMGEVLRLASLVETLAEPLKEAGFEPLLVDVSSIGSFVRGDLDTPIDQLNKVLKQGNLLESAGVILPIAEQIQTNQVEHLLYNSPLELETPVQISVGSIEAKFMRRVVISIVGTSLLTNQINRSLDPNDWFNIIRQSTNYTNEEVEKYHKEAREIINLLKARAIKKLADGNIRNIRLGSAELSVIYALYQGNLAQGKQDYHFLIASDTALCTETANIIQSFLTTQGLNVHVYQPKGLSTNSSEALNNGIDDLLVWLADVASNYKSAGYCISFNLVASSRVLQAYMDVIGMFYADELIYVLEAANPTLISIPKIPIKFDSSVIDPVKFSLMEAGASLSLSELGNVPSILIFIVDNEATLSNWGKFMWNSYKQDFLSQDLLLFPYLAYESSFISDYKQSRSVNDRVKLQETLSKVSYLLGKANGDISILKQDGGLQYRKYVNMNIDIFRVSQDLRVSCMFSDGVLRLRRYGNHHYVNENP